mmetsp:Transcript_8143/g.20571  ORF Transcript_8143/g.20571 Transcript_8143/m.20571 type:complete len:488 (-) Transcript_8143:580-2043(-)
MIQSYSFQSSDEPITRLRWHTCRLHVGGGRAALVAVDERAREHVHRLRVLELRLALEVAVEQRGGGRVEAVHGGQLLALGALLVHVGAHLGRQLLAQFDAPLVEGVEPPHEPLHRDPVLVQRQQLAGGVRVELGQHDGQRRAVAGEGLVGDEVVGDALSAQLHGALAHRQCVGLREEVAHQLVVVGHDLALEVHGLLGLDDADEVAGDGAALVDELVEGVLAVGARLAEVDLARGKRQLGAIDGHALAVGLHGHLLDVGRQLGQRLGVGQDGAGWAVEEGHVEHAQHAEGDGQVLLEGRRGEVLVDVPGALEELLHGIEAVLQGQGQHAHGAAHGVTSAHPVPEGEGVVGVDAELADQLQVGAHGHHVLRYRLLAQRGDDPLPHGARVEHGLRGGERLGHHHHQGGLGVQPVERAGHVHGIDVGQEAQLAPARALRRLAAGLQRGVHKQRAQEGAADADGHDVGQRLARCAQPLAVAHLLAEVLHLV